MRSSVVLALSFAATSVALSAQSARTSRPPATVQRVIEQEQSAGGTLKNVTTEKEHGVTVYEIETLRDGHTRDLLVDADGHVIEIEEEVSINGVPAPVKSAFEAMGAVKKLETITKGSTVTYEAQIQKNGTSFEAVVDAAGQRVKSK